MKTLLGWLWDPYIHVIVMLAIVVKLASGPVSPINWGLRFAQFASCKTCFQTHSPFSDCPAFGESPNDPN